MKIVDTLAEITSYQDRHVLEKSLVKTIHDLFPNGNQRLFRVKKSDDVISITLLAFSEQGITDTSSAHKQKTKINSELLNSMFKKVIDSASVEMFPSEDKVNWYIVYPAFDSNNDIFAILVYTCSQPSFGDQNIIHGILKVYSNYLSLLDKTERDKLTGLYNRETLDNQIIKVLVDGTEDLSLDKRKKERRRINRGMTFLGVIDIDHFKSINDTFGHLYGDEILVLVARLMTESFTRDEDLVFRYGGEEFVVLIKTSSPEDAFNAFERLRTNIENYKFPQLDKVTVSVGFVEITNQLSPHDIIGAADKALYFAKHAGRNRTESYRDLIDEGKLIPNTLPESTDVVFF